MKLIDSLQDLINNALYLNKQFSSNNSTNKYAATQLIRKGMNFAKYTVDGRTIFAPCRFIGYQKNTIKKHTSEELHGSVTKQRINKILRGESKTSAEIDVLYMIFCEKLGIAPYATGNFGNPRKYWDLDNLFTDVYGDLGTSEGEKKYRMHLVRERKPLLRKEAIDNFQRLNGSVYCEVCTFNFEVVYGGHGKDFIECHHTLPLSKMKVGHKSKFTDLALLCSNCHRMIHKSKVKWLTVNELKLIVNKNKL